MARIKSDGPGRKPSAAGRAGGGPLAPPEAPGGGAP